MTLIVGLLCSDGAVVASDSAASFGTGLGMPTIGQQPAKKIEIVGGSIVCATSGDVGISQSICEAVEKAQKAGGLTGSPVAAKDRLADAIGNALAPAFQRAKMALGSGVPQQAILQGILSETIVAAPVDKKAHVWTFSFTGNGTLATKSLPFSASGSGQPIADPFLALVKRIFWSDRQPTLSDGIFAAVWTIEHVKKTNTGGVGGDVQLATVENRQGNPVTRRLKPEEIQEHLESVRAVEEHMAEFKREQTQAEPGDLELPKPPPETTAKGS